MKLIAAICSVVIKSGEQLYFWFGKEDREQLANIRAYVEKYQQVPGTLLFDLANATTEEEVEDTFEKHGFPVR